MMNALFAFLVASSSFTVEPNGLTLEEAVSRVRMSRASGETRVVNVRIVGENHLASPLLLTEEDHDIVFEGLNGASVSGGRTLGPWNARDDGVYEADAPRTADGQVMFVDQMWINGRRAPCARIPNDGYLKLSESEQKAVTNLPFGRETFVERTTFSDERVNALLQTNASELRFVQMGVLHKWSFARRPISSLDLVSRALVTESDDRWCWWKKWNGRETLVYFENVRGGFDAPGEWFLDVLAGKVLYRPLPGEEVESIVAIVPLPWMSNLISIHGRPGERQYVRNLTFRSISFLHSACVNRSRVNAPVPVRQGQAANGSDGVIMLEGAVGCRFENCRVAHTGNYGMRLYDGCVSNFVVGCVFEDLGAGGISLGERMDDPARKASVSRRVILPTHPLSTAFNVVSNCTVRCGGRTNPEGTGVVLGHCSDSKVVHCDIHDLYYSGISVGWSWGYVGSVAQRNEIAFNRIYDLGKGVMSDMGGVYTLGTSFGTRIHDNVIHDICSHAYGGWALYCDEGSEGIVLERNICWNSTDGGFRLHYGSGCIVRNNIFAWNRQVGAVRLSRCEFDGVPSSLDFVNNIVLVRGCPLVEKGSLSTYGVWANNVWYDVCGGESAMLNGSDWRHWVDLGRESSGRFADPCFVDAESFDFRLKANSPALELGFKPLAQESAGVIANSPLSSL